MAAEGRFEVVGGSWVEFDGNIPSGESMMRQFLYGQNFFKDNFGAYSTNFFMPDTFGYSAQLPQIMKEAGIQRFITQKLSWSRFNKFPHNTFYWKGLDGSSVLAHFPPADTYNSDGKLNDVLKSQNNFKDKGVSNMSLMLFGEGDGGGGPERQHIDSILRFKNVEGVPNVKLSTVNEFFNDLEKEDSELYTWQGELYLEIHNGTYTTIANNKKHNRMLEFLFKDIEVMTSIASLHSSDYTDHKEILTKMWKLLLLDQFHDVIPGTSIGMVYEDTKEHYKFSLENSAKIINEFANNLYKIYVDSSLSEALKSYSYCVFNPKEESKESGSNFFILNSENFDRTEYIHFNNQGTVEGGLAIVPQNGYAVLSTDSLLSSGKDSDTITYSEEETHFEINTRFYTVKITKEGRITSYLDKTISKYRQTEIVDQNSDSAAVNAIRVHNDIPDFWDAWDIFDWSRYTHKDILADGSKTKVIQSNKFAIAVQFEYTISKTSDLVQVVYFYAHSQRIDFKSKVNWNENRKLLRTYFPVNVLTDYVTYDIQNGLLRRSSNNNTLWQQAQYEVCGHKFADLSEGAYGVALLNNCKYGYTCKYNTLGLSLLRSPKWPNETADIGTHYFHYSMFVHDTKNGFEDVQKEGYSCNSKLKVFPIHSEVLETAQSLITINSSNVVMDTFKISEHKSDEYILRVHESLGRTSDSEIVLNFLEKIGRSIKSVQVVNGIENDKEDEDHNLISFDESKIISKYQRKLT